MMRRLGGGFVLPARGLELLLELFDGLQLQIREIQIEVDDQPISYRLPANPEGVLLTLKRDAEPRYRNMEQAKRVAWRIVRHWIDAQLAMVESENAKAEEIFLPYMLSADGTTFWECIQRGGGVTALAGGQLALTDGGN